MSESIIGFIGAAAVPECVDGGLEHGGVAGGQTPMDGIHVPVALLDEADPRRGDCAVTSSR
jgi:hypothetical protein